MSLKLVCHLVLLTFNGVAEAAPLDYRTAVVPFSSTELENILARLTAGHNGYISKDLLEAEFRFEIPRSDPNRLAVRKDNPKSFSAQARETWYFDIYFIDTEKETSMSFGLGDSLPMALTKSGLCLRAGYLTETFLENGWVMSSKHVNPTFTAIYFEKNLGRMLFSFNTSSDCFISMTVTTNKI